MSSPVGHNAETRRILTSSISAGSGWIKAGKVHAGNKCCQRQWESDIGGWDSSSFRTIPSKDQQLWKCVKLRKIFSLCGKCVWESHSIVCGIFLRDGRIEIVWWGLFKKINGVQVYCVHIMMDSRTANAYKNIITNVYFKIGIYWLLLQLFCYIIVGILEIGEWFVF